MIQVEQTDDKWRVVHADGTELFSTSKEADAHVRASMLSEIAERRGGEASGADLLVLFPGTAPQPLIFTALSVSAFGELKREDDFDEASGTWKMSNIEIFRSGNALKLIDGEWVLLRFTTDDVIGFVEAFPALGWTPPVKLGHNEEQPWLDDAPAIARVVALRAGEVKDPQDQEQLGLFADLEKVPPSLHDAILSGAYFERSIEYFPNMIPNPSGDGKLRMVLKAVSLLGDELPAVRGMKPIDVAPVKVSADGAASIAKLTTENPKVKTKHEADQAEKPVQLSAEEYKRFKAIETENEERERKLKSLAEQNETLAGQVARLAIDAHEGKADALCARLEGEGRLTPALKARAMPILRVLDREKTDAVKLTVSEEKDGETVEREVKRSAFDAFADFLSSLPKDPNAPGAPQTGGGGTEDPSGYEALGIEAQRAEVAKLAAKYEAEDESLKGDLLAATRKAEADLEAGTAEVTRG